MDLDTIDIPEVRRDMGGLATGASLRIDDATREALLAAAREAGEAVEALTRPSSETSACAVFNSFDFHLGPDGPKLIEVNTNAGGAFIQAELAKRAASALDPACGVVGGPAFDPVEMILASWRAMRGAEPLGSVAIVDRTPESEPLIGDMRIAAEALKRRGVDARVVDAETLEYRNGRLRDASGEIDFVYNRLTDFHLQESHSRALRDAWTDRAVVVAPNPDVYRAYADKSLLVRLAAESPEEKRPRSILPCEPVGPASAESLWARRKSLVFKPSSGYGSKGVVRGSSISRRRFESILRDGYVAQTFTAAPRIDDRGAGDGRRKVDFRVWAHGSTPKLIGSRVFTGQVTSLRGELEGLAPIIWRTLDPEGSCACHV